MTIKRRKPLQRKTPLTRRMPLKRIGKKGTAWTNTRRRIKRDFERQGIVRCETCGADNFLTFAHRRKRRFITTPEELRAVALLCARCHNQIEVLPHARMFERVTELIEGRTMAEENGSLLVETLQHSRMCAIVNAGAAVGIIDPHFHALHL